MALLRDLAVIAAFVLLGLYQSLVRLHDMFYGLVNPGSLSFDPKTEIPDLDGKVIVVTGGNIGLGRETILQLSQHNPSQIYLLARNASKAETAIREITDLVPSARITFLQCDLSSFTSIQACAQDFSRREKRLDILILNAGVMALPPALTEQGYELQFGTNHMGHALLTKLLMPTMLRTVRLADEEKRRGDVRIVVLSSIAHIGCFRGVNYSSVRTTMEKKWTVWRYCQSKLANVLFAKALARQYGDEGITAVSVHPGMVETPIYDPYFAEFGMVGRVAHKVKRKLWTTIPDGAKGTLWASTARLDGETDMDKERIQKKVSRKKRGVQNGVYYAPIGYEGQGTRFAYNDKMADELWEWTQKELEGWDLRSR